MIQNALGVATASLVAMYLLTMTLPTLTTNLDSSSNTYLVPSSQPAEVRDEIRNTLAARNAFRREPLGWKYTSPARSGIFRPCRQTDGSAVDADADGKVDNLVAVSRWRKDWAALNPAVGKSWAALNPAVTDPDWAIRTAAEREAALALAKQQLGVGSDYWRNNEPRRADCDQQRGSVSQGPYYGRH